MGDQGLKRLAELRAEIAENSVARSRVAQLLDEGSFAEIDALAKDAAVVAGFGLVNERAVYVIAQEAAVLGGSLGAESARKVIKILSLAEKTGTPVVFLLDSEGVRLIEGAAVLTAYAQMMAAMAKLSGVVPQIAVALGFCVGGAAMMAAQCDLIIAGGKSALLSAAPQVMSAKAGKSLTAADIGSPEKSAASGLAHIATADEASAIKAAREALGFLPDNAAVDSPVELAQDDWNRTIPELNIGFDADVRDTLRRVADTGVIFELQAASGKGVVTAFAHVGGRAVGIVASQPSVNDGAMCATCCDKAARFVNLCDSFNLPIVSFINTSGIKAPSVERNGIAIKAAARLISAMACATAPKISIVTGQAIGLGFVALGARGLGSDLCLAWPNAIIAPMSAEAMAQAINGDQVSVKAPVEDRARLAEEYAANVADPFTAAAQGDIDDVIEPANTRVCLIAALEMTLGKRESLPPRKQANLPL